MLESAFEIDDNIRNCKFRKWWNACALWQQWTSEAP